MRYAVIDEGTVVNVVVCDDPDFAAAQGWIDLTDADPQPSLGWAHNGTSWTPPADPPAPPVSPAADDSAAPGVTIDADAVAALIDQTQRATTVAQVKAALLALLDGLS